MIKQHSDKTKIIFKNLAAFIVINAACVALVYFYNVFYSYGQYPIAHIPSNILLLLFLGVANLGFIIYLLTCRFFKTFESKAAIAIFFVGLLYVFISPPLQVPDENVHYLRSVTISYGDFDFDADGTYPKTVDATVQAFYSAYTNSNDGSPLKVRTDGEILNTTPQQTQSGTSIFDQFIDYYNIENGITPLEEQRRNTEPVLFVILPFIPQAIGAFIARVLGFGGLGMLYGARIFALLTYTLICKAALLNCKRYKAVFLSFMLLPLTLFMAASCSYDSILLALYFFAASYFCKDEINTKDILLFSLAIIFMSTIKINNLIWIILLLILPKHAFKTKLTKLHTNLICFGSFAALYGAITMYNTFAINGYGEIGRMVEGVSTQGQISFILSNFVSVIARFWGTLFENEFFLSQLGVFGTVDTPIAMINFLSPLVLLFCAVLCVNEKSSLPLRSLFGLTALAIIYTGTNLAGLYVSHTPVGMVRVIGLQARYFLPVYLMFFIVICAALSHVLHSEKNIDIKNSENIVAIKSNSLLNFAFLCCVSFGVLGALLIFETYFIGPVAIVPL